MEKEDREKETLDFMVGLYCRAEHGTGEGLCLDCQDLASYAKARLAKCPYKETRTFCSSCQSPCYRPDMRARIKEVMVYSGPRMLVHRPGEALGYLYQKIKAQGPGKEGLDD